MNRWKFEGKDKRGKVWSFKISETPLKEIMILYTKKGALRGGAVHSVVENRVVLEGRIKMKELREEREIEYEMKEGDFAWTEKEVPHLMESLTESWVMEWHPAGKKNWIHEKYRNVVKEYMKNE